MKIERIKTEKKFQPITISVTIESEEELEALQDMVGYDVSIPDLVNDDRNSKQRQIVQSFLQSLDYQLRSGA